MTTLAPLLMAAAAEELRGLWSDLPESGQSGMNPWAIQDDLGHAGRIALDRGLVPVREKGRWQFTSADLSSPPDWRSYLESFGLGCFDADVADHAERVARGWPLTNEELIAAIEVERDDLRADCDWPGLAWAEDVLGREADWFDGDGRPWWSGQDDFYSVFLCRCGTELGLRWEGVLEDIQADLERSLDLHALMASRQGNVPVQGIGDRWVFAVTPDPFLEPWSLFLETLAHSEVTNEDRRVRRLGQLMRLRAIAEEELRTMHGQERADHPEMRQHEEWAYTFEEVFDEEAGSFVAAPIEY